MCGICGIVHFDKKPVAPRVIDRMTDVMAHRGPDDRGRYIDGPVALGHRRLSIIALAAGHQPMTNEDQTIWLSYNGELYNYLDIRQDLISRGHIFKTPCDTEVIVHLYEEYGIQGLGKMNGMFAFAIWDQKKQELLVVRDRLGVKPFYYYRDKNKFLFASEIKSIIAYEDFPVRPNPAAISSYLSFLYEMDEETLFQGVMKLPPGHYAVLKADGQVTLRAYWDVSLRDNYAVTDETAVISRFNELFEDSITKRLMSDVPVGSFLSGGLDSSAIVTLAAKHYPQLQTFTIGSDEPGQYDESGYARQVAGSLGIRNETVMQQPRDIIDTIRAMIWHLDEPVHGPATIPYYLIAGTAAKKVKVVFSGDGGDEMWLGYHRYLIAYLLIQLQRKRITIPAFMATVAGKFGWQALLPYLRRLHMAPEKFYQDIINLFKPPLLAKLLNPEFSRSYAGGFTDKLDRYFAAAATPDLIKKITYTEMKTYLVSILHLSDKLTMAHSLEARVPFLDYRLVEFAYSVPTELKLKNNMTKYLVRQAMTKVLPPEIINRPKMGFTVPAKPWFKKHLAGHISDILLSTRSRQRGYFNHNYVERLLASQRLGLRDQSIKLWALLCLETWHLLFIDNKQNK